MAISISLKKIDFLKFEIWPIKGKSQILQRIRVWIKWLFCSKILPYGPTKPPWKVHSHLCFPHVCLTLKFYKKFFKNVNCLSFFDIKLSFYFYFPKLYSSNSMYSELSNAFSNVLLSQKLTEIRAFRVMFRNLLPV